MQVFMHMCNLGTFCSRRFLNSVKRIIIFLEAFECNYLCNKRDNGNHCLLEWFMVSLHKMRHIFLILFCSLKKLSQPNSEKVMFIGEKNATL